MYTAAAAAFLSSAGNLPAETFYWINDNSAKQSVSTADWHDFGDPSSWGIGTTPSASNPDGKIPSATDDFHYGVHEKELLTRKCIYSTGGEIMNPYDPSVVVNQARYDELLH